MSGVPQGRIRLRVRFSKLGKIRWTSHRDVARMWERAFRRIQLPLSYSEGFSPRPRVSFGLALSTGHESVAEFLDVEVTGLEGIALDSLPARLSSALPVGIEAAAVAVLQPGTPSLQEDVLSCSWRWLAVPADGSPGVDLAPRLAEVMDATVLEVPRSRKGTEVIEDVRPGILRLQIEGQDPVTGGTILTADLAAQPRAVRPADVLSALGPGLDERDVRRTHQWIVRHGARLEPLVAESGDALEAPHAMERAS